MINIRRLIIMASDNRGSLKESGWQTYKISAKGKSVVKVILVAHIICVLAFLLCAFRIIPVNAIITFAVCLVIIIIANTFLLFDILRFNQIHKN
jgi:hypothetical protein